MEGPFDRFFTPSWRGNDPPPSFEGGPHCPPAVPGKPSSAPGTLFAALVRGARGVCPSCGASGLFASFLKPEPCCAACGQDWAHQNADDFPPYIVILLLGHVIVPLLAFVEVEFHPPIWVHLALWLPLTILLAITLLQPAKGAVIAYQWWSGMGGFGPRATIGGDGADRRELQI